VKKASSFMLVLKFLHTQYPSAFLVQGGMLGWSLQESASLLGSNMESSSPTAPLGTLYEST